MTGVWHYGRALAYIHTGQQDMARGELDSLVASRKAMGEVEHYVGFATAETLMTIAEETVRGEFAYNEGNTIAGLAHLERAVRLEDGLRYNEPPDWYFPLRHFLGAMLLDAGRPNEAEVVYAEDLRRNPENGYSLFGLQVALKQQGKIDDALAVGKRLNRAWSDATHTLRSSRF
jgi:tetratricopeptide (TPR) repeat protein